MWRPATSTSGTNDVPLGNRRRFGPAPTEGEGPPPQQYNNGGGGAYGPPPSGGGYQNEQPRYGAVPPPPGYGGSNGGGGGGYGGGVGGYGGGGGAPYGQGHGGAPGGGEGYGGGAPTPVKRERSAEPSIPEDPNAPRKRRSRWGDEKPAGVNPGMPTAIMGSNVSQAELDQYAMRLRVEEINTKLRTNDVVPPERTRSPSPPPTYDAHGRRTNTREVRYRKKLEDERLKLIDKTLKLDPTFKPPTDYHAAKRNSRPQDKVYIPVKEFPEINFFGLLVGPRGNSLKKMEKESGAKISIRGKGSVKEGKGRPENTADDADEDLHCLITSDDPVKVKACVDLINSVIAIAASTPEGQNDHKRNQLRELAALNGTLRDDEGQVCINCGELGHKKWDCPEQRNYSAGIICHNCGSAGHMARDCRTPRGQGGPPNGMNGGGPKGPGGHFDAEYASLMNELGEGGGVAMGGSAGMIEGPGSEKPKPPPWAAGGAAAGGGGGGGGQYGQGGGAPGGQEGGPEKLAPWRDPGNWITPNQRNVQYNPQQQQQQYNPYAQQYQQQQAYPGYAQPQHQQYQQPQQAAYPGYGQQQAAAAYSQQYPGYGAAAADPNAAAAAAQPSASAYESYYAQLAAAGGGGSVAPMNASTPQGAGGPGA